LWLDPRVKPYANNDPAVKPLYDAVSLARARIERVAKMRFTPNPFKTQAGNQEALEQEFNRATEVYASRMDSAKQRAKAELEALERKRNEALPESKHATEIRNYVRSLPEEKRTEFIETAINNGDLDTASAVINGPSYLSGIGADLQGHYLDSIAEIRNPGLKARRQAIQHAMSIAENTTFDMINDYERLVDTRELKQAREGEKAAEAAQAYEPSGDAA